jgi:hypothetical protein
MKKWSRTVVIAGGIVGMLANIVGMIRYFSGDETLGTGIPDRGLLTFLSFVLFAYALAIWSMLVWRWTLKRKQQLGSRNVRPAAILLDGLAAIPILTLWLNLLFSIVLYDDVDPAQRWLAALVQGTMIAPLIALGLAAIGDTLGPLLGVDE